MHLGIDITNSERIESFWSKLQKLVIEYERLCAEENSVRNKSLHSESKGEELISLEESIRAVNAILKVAAAHTSERAPHDEAFPYDREKLVALQVQIDPHSRDDQRAAELFREAYGQLNWLNRKVDGYHASIADRRARLLQEQDESSRQNTQKRKEIVDGYNEILCSDAFAVLLSAVVSSQHDERPLLGYVQISLPLPEKKRDVFKNSLKLPNSEVLDPLRCVVKVSITLDWREGASFLLANKPEDNPTVLGEPAGFILNMLNALNRSGTTVSMSYIDPLTFSPTSLGEMSVLIRGDNPVIADAPRSPEEMRSFFASLGSRIISFDDRLLGANKEHQLTDIFVFRDYPQGYDGTALAFIRKLTLMAKEYGVIVILQESQNTDAHSQLELQEEAARRCAYVLGSDGKISLPDSPQERLSFQWAPMPPESQSLIDGLLECANRAIDDENNYSARIGATLSGRIIKGDRALSGLPIGVSQDGSIVDITFEDENFATFTCGAARSRKSTLLHTLLTSIFTSKHPDDVEVWLVDFKMTEFSRYTASPPPHVRYIVLDESPELVYDLLDRLTEVMSKRQALFKKNGWVKLSDAQAEGRYMPALFIVIDEFSVMSKIIADSALAGKDYKDKLQMLLAKGAALGFRFVFASQSFTQGTRGLNEFSKKQIQQRIAMKTDYAEVKETLDLPSINDDERKMIEGLVPHYALLSMPSSSAGRISKAHVLYFNDANEQSNLLYPVFSQYKTADVYDPNTFESYISKKPQVFDGNELADYSFVDPVIESIIGDLREQSYDPTSMFICVGQPTRMKECVPIELVRGFAENILFVTPAAKGEAFQSVVAAVAKSLRYVKAALKIIVPRSTPLMPNRIAEAIPNLRTYFGVAGLELFVRERATTRSEDAAMPTLTILLNPETLLGGDFVESKLPLGICASVSAHTKSPATFQTRMDGEDDLSTKMKKGDLEVDVKLLLESRGNGRGREIVKNDPEDAMRRCNALFGLVPEGNERESDEGCAGSVDLESELLKLLEGGSKRDEHFMVVTSNPKELKKIGVSPDWFRHRLAFRMAREDARDFMSRTDADVVTELANNCFRYANGLDGVTFRPYSHFDLGILSEETFGDVDEYLL